MNLIVESGRGGEANKESRPSKTDKRYNEQLCKFKLPIE
jgi:hypothetical protein